MVMVPAAELRTVNARSNPKSDEICVERGDLELRKRSISRAMDDA
jgi:hypothetical protein